MGAPAGASGKKIPAVGNWLCASHVRASKQLAAGQKTGVRLCGLGGARLDSVAAASAVPAMGGWFWR
ncbi:hypothetical protein D3791_15555 [Glutamicibacter mishrai]|uniref:Uncharacterized protein n=2 Tax=Glutamicibacter mishrai TaxID=1775880 RepID=A0A6H0SLW8_9MICC|nr:hypothetical protein D3791_15555 [Glutamicibacter mishrai]